MCEAASQNEVTYEKIGRVVFFAFTVPPRARTRHGVGTQILYYHRSTRFGNLNYALFLPPFLSQHPRPSLPSPDLVSYKAVALSGGTSAVERNTNVYSSDYPEAKIERYFLEGVPQNDRFYRRG